MLLLKDEELVQRAQQGHEEAVGELYDRHQLRIYRYVRSRIYDDQLAHDLTGEIFLRMLANIHTYEYRNVPFTAWLYRIARNFLADYVQSTSRVAIVPLRQADHVVQTAVNPSAIVERQLDLEAVLNTLDQLDEIQREVLTLRFLVGLSLKEVASSLDKSVAAVKSIQHRGLKTMKALMPDPV